MSAAHPTAAYRGLVVDPDQRITIVDVARGGMVPSYVFQRELLLFMDPSAVRVDHVYMQRVSDDSGRVVGVETSGSKIGGTVGDSTVLIPDPMGATGSSMVDVVKLYSDLPGGAPERLITCHLIITPEFLRRLLDADPRVEVYALRLDRGLSPESVLAQKPGTSWDQERGLDDTDYIVPGAGGLGELVNNAFV
jgi:uracil phosphoribosyltransferase